MATADTKLIRARITAILKQLQSASEKSKQENVSLTTVNDFNALHSKILEMFPDAKESFPERIKPGSLMLEREGLASLSFLDLELKCRQVLEVLTALDSDS